MKIPPKAWLLLSLCAAGCNANNVNGTNPAALPPPPNLVSEGTILTMRIASPQATGEPWRALLANAGATASPSNRGNDPMMEFIVRQDDGSLISVIQGNELSFRPGQRVTIVRGRETHLALVH